jgi:hypothetical protein
MTLWEAARQLAVAFTGMFLVMSVWIGIQSYVRKRSGGRPDHDVLDYMAHGCGSCVRGQTCRNRMKNAGLNPGMEREGNESE